MAKAKPASPEVLELRKKIKANADRYTNRPGDLFITDSVFDGWCERLAAISPLGRKDPELKKVGAKATSALPKALHTAFMGSQFKAMTPQEFKEWYEKVGSPVVYVNHKVDGASLRGYYSKGKVDQAVTRGDGKEGEDITLNAIRFMGFPSKVKETAMLSVRGEAVLFKKEWLIVDPEQTGNPRNLGTGITLRSDGTQSDLMHFLAFDIDVDLASRKGFATEEDKVGYLQESGFTIIEGRLCKNLAEIMAFYEETAKRRDKLPYWIDGLVIKINDLELQRSFGISDNRPKGQISFKFPAEQAQTILREVLRTVGHTGAIVPTAVFDAVRLGGTTVTNALLCNDEYIKELDVAIGDTVIVEKRGEIIPQIVEVINRPKNRVPIHEPKVCPVCGGEAKRRVNTGGEAGAVTECINDECEAKLTGKIKRWLKSLDIQGIGDEVLAALASTKLKDLTLTYSGVKELGEAPIVGSVPALYRLRTLGADRVGCLLINDKRLGEKRAQTIIDEIEKKKKLTIDQFLGSLGIKHLGKRRVEIIRKAAMLIPEVLKEHPNFHPNNIMFWETNRRSRERAPSSSLCTFAERLGIPGIATEIQEGIDARHELINELLTYLDIIEPVEAPVITGGKLSGKTFCLTGEMSRGRKEIAADIVKLGGLTVDDVKAGVILVSADIPSSSSKYKKAGKLKCEIISEGQLTEMMKG